jgi:hypothetical protein
LEKFLVQEYRSLIGFLNKVLVEVILPIAFCVRCLFPGYCYPLLSAIYLSLFMCVASDYVITMSM